MQNYVTLVQRIWPEDADPYAVRVETTWENITVMWERRGSRVVRVGTRVYFHDAHLPSAVVAEMWKQACGVFNHGTLRHRRQGAQLTFRFAGG